MKIKFKDVEKKVRQLAADNPDNRYRELSVGRCYYTKGKCSNGSVGCIFGQALEALGVSRSVLVKHGDDDEEVGVAASSLLKELGVKMKVRDRDWANGVQHTQDLGLSWKTAVDDADIIQD